MKDCGVIQGSSKQAQPLIVGKDTVYIHTNITQITEDSEGNPISDLYSYNEVQYTKDEYIKLISEQNSELKQQVLNTQLALCDIYELVEGGTV